MGLTKQYLRFVPKNKFNIINSCDCNISFVTVNDREGRYVAVGASEDIIIWDLRLSKKVLQIEGEKATVQRLTVNSTNSHLAAGFSDGITKTFNLLTGENIHSFCGHRSPISALTYDSNGHFLATGSKDTDVVIWDVIAENGVHRLSGHKGVITDIKFMSKFNVVITSSKDTFIKFWDLTSGFCFKTITDHITEVWSIILLRDETYMIAASCDNELRVYEIKENTSNFNASAGLQELLTDDINFASPIVCTKIGSVLRESKGRVAYMSVDKSSQLFCCYGNDKILELFYLVSEEEAKKKFNKRRKKLKDKIDKCEGEDPSLNRIFEDLSKSSPSSLKYLVSRLPVIRTSSKIKSSSVVFLKEHKAYVVISLSNNSIELYSLSDLKSKEYNYISRISNPGHNSDVKVISFSWDSRIIATGSQSGLKIWNKETLSCIRTVDIPNILSICFVIGDCYMLIGTRNGSLIIVNVANGDIIETIAAHEADLSNVSMLPNKTCCVTGSSDKTIQFWQLGTYSDNLLSLSHSRTLKVDEPVLCIKVSPDSNLIAASLLDCTVKIFFMDSFKFFLSLYGHKLPVTCLDISYDSTLIATGSADRNIKIWGLDYGDCHKSIFAHEDSVMSLSFIPQTHYFFTCGKDGLIKQWDGDNFERIITLQGHNGEAWNLSVSTNGDYLASCGQDRVVRLYKKSEKPVVLEDEREVEREEEDAKTLATGTESVVTGRAQLSLASKKTVTAEKGAELLLECIEIIKKYNDELKESTLTNKPPPPIPLIFSAFNAKTTNEYFISVLKKIRYSDLEETLLLLPLFSVSDLFNILLPLLKKTHSSVELIIRVLVFVVRLNLKPVASSSELYPVIKALRRRSTSRVSQLKDIFGLNYYTFLLLQYRKESKEGIQMFENALFTLNKKKAKKRKNAMMIKTALLKL